jgi:uncharacterized protein (DUF2267 family)
MSVRSVDAVERSVHKTNEWLAEVSRELGVENEEVAWRILRAYLQVLRDRLTVDEAAQFAAQLPNMLRGAFYDGFDPSRQPEKIRDRDTFLARLADRAQLPSPADAELAAAAVTRVLRRHVSEGEFNDVLSQLPSEIRDVLQPSAA